MENSTVLVAIIGVIGTAVSGVVSYLSGKKEREDKRELEDDENKTEIQKTHLEGESNLNKIVASQIGAMYERQDKMMDDQKKYFEQRLTEQKEEFNKRIIELEKKLSTREKENEYLMNQIEEKDDEIDCLHTQLDQKDDIIREKENTIDRYKKANDNLLWDIQKLKEEK